MFILKGISIFSHPVCCRCAVTTKNPTRSCQLLKIQFSKGGDEFGDDFGGFGGQGQGQGQGQGGNQQGGQGRQGGQSRQGGGDNGGGEQVNRRPKSVSKTKHLRVAMRAQVIWDHGAGMGNRREGTEEAAVAATADKARWMITAGATIIKEIIMIIMATKEATITPSTMNNWSGLCEDDVSIFVQIVFWSLS